MVKRIQFEDWTNEGTADKPKMVANFTQDQRKNKPFLTITFDELCELESQISKAKQKYPYRIQFPKPEGD